MARIKIGGGTGESGKFIKWADVPVGTAFTGTWRGTKKGKFGDLGDLETAEGLVTFPVTSDETGRTYHTFGLYKLTDGDAEVPF